LELVSRNTRTNRMMNAESPTIPILSCAQRTLLRSGMLLFPVLHELCDVGIRRGLQPVLIAFENQPAIFHHHENGSRVAARPVASGLQAPMFRIVAEICDQVSVLVP